MKTKKLLCCISIAALLLSACNNKDSNSDVPSTDNPTEQTQNTTGASVDSADQNTTDPEASTNGAVDTDKENTKTVPSESDQSENSGVSSEKVAAVVQEFLDQLAAGDASCLDYVYDYEDAADLKNNILYDELTVIFDEENTMSSELLRISLLDSSLTAQPADVSHLGAGSGFVSIPVTGSVKAWGSALYSILESNMKDGKDFFTDFIQEESSFLTWLESITDSIPNVAFQGSIDFAFTEEGIPVLNADSFLSSLGILSLTDPNDLAGFYNCSFFSLLHPVSVKVLPQDMQTVIGFFDQFNKGDYDFRKLSQTAASMGKENDVFLKSLKGYDMDITWFESLNSTEKEKATALLKEWGPIQYQIYGCYDDDPAESEPAEFRVSYLLKWENPAKGTNPAFQTSTMEEGIEIYSVLDILSSLGHVKNYMENTAN